MRKIELNLKKFLLSVFSIALFVTSQALGQSRVTLTIDTRARGAMIPPDFIGESFEVASLRNNVHGVKGYLFDSSNNGMVTLFKNLGIKNLRIGGGTVDMSDINPTGKDIDALFGFAKAADVKVIYSVRLLNGNAREDASIAKYVWDNYREYLVCFAIGNEPDWHSYHLKDPEIFETTPGVPGSAYPSYLAKWKRIAAAILDSVPGAEFTGPDAGSNYPVLGAKDTYYNGKPLAVNFVGDISNWLPLRGGSLKFVDQHNYVGQDAKSKELSPAIMADRMLSPDWDTYYYPALYDAVGTRALPKGVGYRMTESNSFSGGVKGGSDCFATALFTLDYLHWWAAHGCLGVNFHTTQWRSNGTIYLDKDGQYQVHPMAYGIKAFDLGGHGEVKPVKISNPDGVNMSAYAVEDSASLYVTIVNKEHGGDAREVDATIDAAGLSRNAKAIYLMAADGNILSTTGIVLGGAPINGREQWKGEWSGVKPRVNGRYVISVPACSAAVIKIRLSDGDKQQ